MLNPCIWQHGERWGGVRGAKHETKKKKKADFPEQIHKMPAEEPPSSDNASGSTPVD